MNRRFAAVAALSVFALGAVGCAQNTTPTSPPPPPAQAPGATMMPTQPGANPTQAADPQAHNDAALRAVATAEGAANGTAYEIDDEELDGNWEVDVMVGDRSVEVTVSNDGNTALSQEDDDDADNDDRGRVERANVSLAQAIEAALPEVPGGSLDDVELEDEDGRDAWQVSIDTPGLDDTEVYVSTQDGSIIRVDR